ncbi:MAG TPA: hypothetical protein VFR37_24975, partial [Longimicrobium sp.]|nr:hypothetical protein [Longimicrobium sp.]
MTRPFLHRMQRRFLFSGLVAALALAAGACADQTPTLSGEDQFPPGSIPVTREVILPASEFIRTLGSFSGYTRASDAPYVVVANQYGGALDAHGLALFRAFPTKVTYVRNGATREDTLFTYADSRLVLGVDSAAVAGAPLTVQVWEATERWDPFSATWTMAVDTAGERLPWTEPGGTRGALIAQATLADVDADSLVITLPGAAVTRLADSTSNGIVLTIAETGKRIELSDLLLRAAIKPDSANPDTTIIVTVGTGPFRTTVYTPEQPDAPLGTFGVGGIRSARTLLELDLEQTVPGCAVGQTCAEVPIGEVQLNQVAILLRPATVPSGFGALNRVPIAMRLVEEPELGRVAPLGQTSLDRDVTFAPGDTVVVLPITSLTATLAANDSIPRTFALVSEIAGIDAPPTFGAAFFEPAARLRIIYTLP